MILRPYIVEGTGCASYFFGCPTAGTFAVVDPHPHHTDDYVEAAERAGGEIVQVFDTHVPADHRSSGRRMTHHEPAARREEREPERAAPGVVQRHVVQLREDLQHAGAHECADIGRKAGAIVLAAAEEQPPVGGEAEVVHDEARVVDADVVPDQRAGMVKKK